jgi:hypothetical protein
MRLRSTVDSVLLPGRLRTLTLESIGTFVGKAGIASGSCPPGAHGCTAAR